MAMDSGTVLGDYRLLSRINRGGMGDVWLAEHIHLEKLYAVKILPEELVGDKQFVERFRQEARLMAEMDHPNIVRMHHFGRADDYYYLVMDYIEGPNGRPENLDQLAALTGGKIEEKEFRRLFKQVLEALKYAHSFGGKGVVHRDLKPANLLIDKSGNVKVTDFGLAKIVGDQFMRTVAESSVLRTQTGTLLGTYEYMSPEQRDGQHVDHRSDIYSLGVVVYRMLTGTRPIGRFKRPSVIVPGLPKIWDELTDSCLEPDPHDRPQTIEQISTRLNLGDRNLMRERSAPVPASAPESAQDPVPPPKKVPSPPPKRVTKANVGDEILARVSSSGKAGSIKAKPSRPKRSDSEKRSSATEGVLKSTRKGKRRSPLLWFGIALSLVLKFISERKEQPSRRASAESGPGERGARRDKPVSRPQPSGRLSSSFFWGVASVGGLLLTTGYWLAVNDGQSEGEPGVNNARPSEQIGATKQVSMDSRSAEEKPGAVSPAKKKNDYVKYTARTGGSMIWVPGGSFQMGSPRTENGRHGSEHLHKVALDGFWMGEYEITNSQFSQFVKETGYVTSAEKSGWGYAFQNSGKLDWIPGSSWQTPSNYYGWTTSSSRHPVVHVDWFDATAFCGWLSDREGLDYRLPTEAQWEYACRAGSSAVYAWGNYPKYPPQCNAGDPSYKSAYRDDTTKFRNVDGHQFTAPVGTYPKNGFGLGDMHGNVWEWCSDKWDFNYYRESPLKNPLGPSRASVAQGRKEARPGP